jgi:succinoglycan biosynthesis transport protein ExoP
MVDHLEEKNSEGFDLQHYLRVARRHHLHFLISLLLGWLVVWGASWVLPPSYKSSTLILVEQGSMPKDYVVPNVNEDLQERLQSITQQILSRTRLLRIIDQLKLYGGSHSQITPDEKVEGMRKDIGIGLVRDTHDNQITAFNVSYSASDPHVAQQVTSELTNMLINENLEERQKQSEHTTNFLESQMENARKSLGEQEAKIREFKGQHLGELPAQQASNLQILSGLQSQLQNEQDALNTAKQQRVYLQTLINQYQALQRTSKTANGAPMGLPAIDVELDRLKSQLADLSSRYTDRHPDLRKLRDQIAKTEKMRDQLVADLNKGNGSQSDGGTVTSDVVDLSQNSPLLQLQGQLQGNQSEITNREEAIARLRVKVTDYQARLNQEPVREQQLADLTRGYDQSKANYDELLKKKNQSAMATSMEQMQQGARFRILDPPSLPLKPDFPNRLKFCGIGLGIGLALGVVVAGGFEMMDDRLYSEKEIKDLVPVAVICEIPEILNPSGERSSKQRMWLGWGIAALVFATIMAGSAFSYLHG